MVGRAMGPQYSPYGTWDECNNSIAPNVYGQVPEQPGQAQAPQQHQEPQEANEPQESALNQSSQDHDAEEEVVKTREDQEAAGPGQLGNEESEAVDDKDEDADGKLLR